VIHTINHDSPITTHESHWNYRFFELLVVRRFWDDLDFRAPAVRLPADRFRAAVLFVPLAGLFFFFLVVPLFRETPLPPPSGMPGRFSMTSSAVSDMRLPAPSSCRCSVPIIRPRDSAERISSDSSSRDRSRCFLAGSTLPRLAIQAPPRGPVALAYGFSKLRAKRLRRVIDGFCNSVAVSDLTDRTSTNVASRASATIDVTKRITPTSTTVVTRIRIKIPTLARTTGSAGA
jgi:hypothetical protein